MEDRFPTIERGKPRGKNPWYWITIKGIGINSWLFI